MNGLITIFEKQDTSAQYLNDLLNRGLKSLSHRGEKAHTSFLMDSQLRNVSRTEIVRNNPATEPGYSETVHGYPETVTGYPELAHGHPESVHGHPESVHDYPEASARLGMAICSMQSSTSHIASHNGHLLFFEGRLTDKTALYQELGITAKPATMDGQHGNATVAVITDADVVLRLLEQQGIGCLKQLKGFWSLIYLDATHKIIYGARDHFGNRPMYFCHTDRHFALASEGRALYAMLDDVRTINKNTVLDFLLWGNIGLVDQHFFRDIHSIEPSHFVKYEMETDKLSVERYYTLPYNRNKASYNEASEKIYTDEIRRLMTESVVKNLDLFDGPVAAGLSGGMDSSSLLCLARQTRPDKTVVAYTTTDEYDGGEIKWAEKVVRQTGVEWIKVVCTSAQIIENIDKVNRRHSAPLYNASSFTQYRVIEEIARQGQLVLLDGQGGDEMFGGYPTYFPLFLKSLFQSGAWKSGWYEFRQFGNSGITQKELCTRLLKQWAKAHYYTPLRLAQKKRKEEFEALIPHARERYFESPSPIPEIKKEVLNDMLFESYTLFLGNILRWGEHSAASFGIECIMPLSDSTDLTEYIFSIASAFKIHNGWNKYLQRKAMVGIVPDEICWRKEKLGFYFPERQWLEEMKNAIFDVIQRMDDPEECIHKKYILENWNRLYTPSNLLFQQFAFRCYSYLLWRNGLGA